MKNRHVMPVLAGATAILLGLLLLGAVPLFGLLQENLVNHVVGITLIAFLGLISYEDWKDARRERLNNDHRNPDLWQAEIDLK